MPRPRAMWNLLHGVHRRVMRANLSLVAAGGAFFAMLSIFPALAAVIAVLGFFANPHIIDQQLATLSDFVPEQAMAILEAQISRLIEANPSVLGWATLLSTMAALWSARRGTDGLIQALNTVYDVPQRGGLGSILIAVLLTAALMGVVVVALLTMVVLPIVLAFLPLGDLAQLAAEVARWIVGVVVVISGIWVLYRFAPNRSGKDIAWLTPGALLAIIVWGLSSWGFAIYLRNFGSYNEIYGSIGAVIALMMFLYITIYTVLLGATLNAELHHKKQARMGLPDEPDAAIERVDENRLPDA